MTELFQLLCGLLYMVGYPFGWTYQETSIYICIYLWPILCCLSTVPIIFVSLSCIVKHKISGIVLTLLSVVYLMYYLFYTNLVIDRYNISNVNSFNNCMLDLQMIARQTGVTYEELNIYIYVVLFIIIMTINYTIYRTIKWYRNRNTVCVKTIQS